MLTVNELHRRYRENMTRLLVYLVAGFVNLYALIHFIRVGTATTLGAIGLVVMVGISVLQMVDASRTAAAVRRMQRSPFLIFMLVEAAKDGKS